MNLPPFMNKVYSNFESILSLKKGGEGGGGPVKFIVHIFIYPRILE